MRYRLILALGCAMLGGCVGGVPWNTYYQQDKSVVASGIRLTPREKSDCRQIKPEDLQRAVARVEEANRAKKTAPEDMTFDDKVEARKVLFEEVCLREDPASTVLIGESAFYAPQPANATDPNLDRKARAEGADIVLVCTSFGGERQGVAYAPTYDFTTNYQTGRASGYAYNDRGNWARANAWGSSTGYSSSSGSVPVPVTIEKWNTNVFFFRRLSADEVARMRSVK